MANVVSKSKLIDLVAKALKDDKIKKTQIEKVINATLDEIKESLKGGNDVRILGFGSFKVIQRKERIGRIPGKPDSEPIKIPARKVVKFVPGSALKEEIN